MFRSFEWRFRFWPIRGAAGIRAGDLSSLTGADERPLRPAPPAALPRPAGALTPPTEAPAREIGPGDGRPPADSPPG